MNIHAYPYQIFHTGLVRIEESFTAHYVLELITNHLSLFGISMESDVVAIVCDGSSVMVNLCRVSRVESMLCNAHGIHLAVMAVLYKNKSVQTEFKDTYTRLFEKEVEQHKSLYNVEIFNDSADLGYPQ